MGKRTLKELEDMGLYYRCDDVKSRSGRKKLKDEAIAGIYDRLKEIRTEEASRNVVAFNKTKKAKMLGDTRTLLQKISIRKKEEDRRYLAVVIETKDKIFELVKDIYVENEIETNKEFEEMYESIKPALDVLESMCKEARVAQFYSSHSKSEYDQLFTNLIKKVDIRFVAYAPKRVLQPKSFFEGLKVVDYETLQKLIMRAYSFGLFNDSDMEKVLKDYHAKCIKFYKQQSNKNEEKIESTVCEDSECDCD